VERALDTLELLAAAGPGGRTLTELAEQIAVSKSSAFALLQSPLISLTMPVLQSVTDATGLTTRLLTPDGAYAIITARIDAPGTCSAWARRSTTGAAGRARRRDPGGGRRDQSST
jgi:IclR family acetate operon transcriptional repressor